MFPILLGNMFGGEQSRWSFNPVTGWVTLPLPKLSELGSGLRGTWGSKDAFYLLFSANAHLQESLICYNLIFDVAELLWVVEDHFQAKSPVVVVIIIFPHSLCMEHIKIYHQARLLLGKSVSVKPSKWVTLVSHRESLNPYVISWRCCCVTLNSDEICWKRPSSLHG